MGVEMSEHSQVPLGIAGRLAKTFLHSPLTPLFAIIGFALGIAAIFITPKEEEPQIEVTFADIFIHFPGATPQQVEQLVTIPAEQVISELKDIDTLYSFSQSGQSVIIVAFKVGKPRQQALVDLYNQLMSNRDWLPPNLGVGEPIVKPHSIDDVHVLALTLWSKKPEITAEKLTQVAHTLETDLKGIAGTREIRTIGAHDRVVSVTIDPARLSAYKITWPAITRVIQSANEQKNNINITQDNRSIPVQIGTFLSSANDIAQLVVGSYQGKIIYLSDVATIKDGADIPDSNVLMSENGQFYPAVTISIAKQSGVNAVTLNKSLIDRTNAIKNILIPEDINVTITRDYGETAQEKSSTLIGKLIFATASVVFLVWLSMGFREAIVVGAAVILTLSITLFASWAWGFTINRISLFALIFSIGILVDDAIVVVENIHRYQALDNDWRDKIPYAVDEVGNPTILATLTVIAALLPMAFVSGMMGPYMSPIPINASTGMIISLIVAFIVTPWLAWRTLKKNDHKPASKASVFFTTLLHSSLSLFITSKNAKSNRALLLVITTLLLFVSLAMPVFKLVILKMLPFDNKSEFQVLLNMPEGSSLEKTQAVLQLMAIEVESIPEVIQTQVYSGTAAPINFNGLVRHYFLRSAPELGDIQVNLKSKHDRHRSSHAIAKEARSILEPIASQAGGSIKIVEIPPGPPVWSPILAEVYGPSQVVREKAANDVLNAFIATNDIVDIDVDIPATKHRLVVSINRDKAMKLNISEASIRETLTAALQGSDISQLHDDYQKYATPIRLKINESDKIDLQGALNLTLTSSNGAMVPIRELVTIRSVKYPNFITHKNSQPMIMVTADMAGELDSPLYGMADIYTKIKSDLPYISQSFVGEPHAIPDITLKWDGEWKITYETFRDMGSAYSVGLLLIYFLVVSQFKSYLVPLIIMVPIPLTIIGVMPGHAVMHAPFTATSMIGMIALAGIIVRNSILLVDFINQEINKGQEISHAVIQSGIVRAKPIILTALAAMIGALFILDDPIFSGLAISLIFGLFVSTILTLYIIPVLYYLYLKHISK